MFRKRFVEEADYEGITLRFLVLAVVNDQGQKEGGFICQLCKKML